MTELVFLTTTDAVIFLQLLLSLILGMVLGLERSIVGKRAGMRTFALVSIASCLFVVLSELISARYLGIADVNPLRVAAAIITGIGFLGTGIIIFDKELKGLTTAASLWVTAGIGMSVGFGFYAIAIFTTCITIFVFEVLWHVERFAAKHVRLPNLDDEPVVVESTEKKSNTINYD